MEGMKMQVKESLRSNLVRFEMAKLEFERTLAPMLIQEFHHHFDDSWVGKIEEAVDKLKDQFDSEAFQYVELHNERPNPQHISRWPIFVFLVTALICLLCSTFFHLFHPMSECKTFST